MSFKTIKLVTDSVADLPDDLIQQWDITVVPAFVIYGGNSYADDGIHLVREDFYEMLRVTPDISPTTAAMPPATARDGIQTAFDKGADHVIILTTPAPLSGIHNAFRLAAQEFPDDRVTVLDSQQLSLGMGWQVLIGAEMAAETGNVDQTIAAINQVRQHQHTYAVLITLEFLRRSGRVSGLTASIGSLLGIKLIIQVAGGEVLSAAKVRTVNRAFDKLVDLVQSRAPFDRAAIMHANNLQGARTLRERLADLLPPDTRIESVCPAIGAHGGPGIVGIATVTKGWKDALSTRNTG